MTPKIILFILDGCRPDALRQAQTPHIDSLWQNGAYTWTARTIMPSVTLPAHTSMFKSVSPEKHGVGADNVFRPSAAVFPSFIDAAMRGGFSTAMFYSWEQLRDLNAPGSLSLSYCRFPRDEVDKSGVVADTAAAYLVSNQPDVCVIYLDDVDLTGHESGWMSPEYMAAVERSDAAVGRVMNALKMSRLRDQYTILLLADHGGHGDGHGTDMPEDMTIPWILSGAGIKRDYEIQTPVSILDTAPTIVHLLGLSCPDVWEGRVVIEALESGS
jgi:predicted AlkP superfamily pyrophosphatase or phosphodiesterase